MPSCLEVRALTRRHIEHLHAGYERTRTAGKVLMILGAILRYAQRRADHHQPGRRNVRRSAEHLREGHYAMGVNVGDDEAAKRRAAEALVAADAQYVHYYAENYVEDL